MSHTIAEIAAATGLDAAGDMSLRVRGIAAPQTAGPDQLAVALSSDYADAVGSGRARAAILWTGADWQAMGLEAALFAQRARAGLAAITTAFAPDPGIAEPGVHPTAIVAPDVRIAEDVAIGPFAVIGPRASVGRGAVIGAHVTLARDVSVGEGSILHPGVRIGWGVEIGARAILHANVCLGADGFSFATPERGSVEAAKETGEIDAGARNRSLLRIASHGRVRLGPDVEVGAGSCIDRGTLADTTIGAGTKIDNLVQIGHNVTVGTTCLICGHVGIAGSVRIGDRVVLGGKVGVADHVRIGHDSVVAGGSLVGNSLADGSVVIGAPAIDKRRFYRQTMALNRLPRVLDELRGLRAKLGL